MSKRCKRINSAFIWRVISKLEPCYLEVDRWKIPQLRGVCVGACAYRGPAVGNIPVTQRAQTFYSWNPSHQSEQNSRRFDDSTNTGRRGVRKRTRRLAAARRE